MSSPKALPPPSLHLLAGIVMVTNVSEIRGFLAICINLSPGTPPLPISQSFRKQGPGSEVALNKLFSMIKALLLDLEVKSSCLVRYNKKMG